MMEVLIILSVVLVSATFRLLWMLRPSPSSNAPRKEPAHLLVVLGSGGHTAEMLAMLEDLDPKCYLYRSYLISEGDAFSAEKARAFEDALPLSEKGDTETTSFNTVPRARRVHQPLLTTPFTCFKCLIACLRVLISQPAGLPDLILTNGPATALIMILAAWILKYFALSSFHDHGRSIRAENRSLRLKPECLSGTSEHMKTIYVESWARVKTPSMSLRIIRWLHLCDRVLVQHRPLADAGWGEYKGDLIR